MISRVHVYEIGRELWKTLFIELMMWFIRVGTTRLRSVLLQGVRNKTLDHVAGTAHFYNNFVSTINISM
jgi:hypothetical protein